MTTFRGSCLCGEVAFEVEGPFDRFQWASRAEWYVHGDALPVED
ncbi:hypothetical protein ACFQZO_08555 [Bradyrhizobium sp. GCM10027634]|nr:MULTISPECIES: hypothetical protein [unclassified Bradyrhizobium]MDN5000931.1 hypothetical protein [Bradyrhizobium sp. WYCCWR 12677]